MNENNPHLMGTEPIGKLLLQYSIPAIIGMTIVSLYNIIDSIFIGHGVGAMAIAGLAITFPMMNLTAAFGNLVSAGGSTISSIRLGQKDMTGVNKVLGNTLMLCIVNSVIFGGLSFLFLDPILRFFGASGETLPYARDFMQIILAGTPFAYVMIGMNYVMRATGHPKKAMLTSMTSVLVNVILAPLFIFQFDWGIRGAALATVCSQFIGMLWVLNHFLNKKSDIRLQRPYLKLERRIVGDIFSIGMSPFLMNVTACVIVIIINNALSNHGGDLAIGSYGIINRLLMLYLMIVMGLTMGMQPIIGYNFGARKPERVKQTLRLIEEYRNPATSDERRRQIAQEEMAGLSERMMQENRDNLFGVMLLEEATYYGLSGEELLGEIGRFTPEMQQTEILLGLKKQAEQQLPSAGNGS